VPRILLDENLPIALKRLLTGRDVATVKDMGWRGIQNGALLASAQQPGFEVLITGNKNLGYQQNPAGRMIALVVLSETQWALRTIELRRVAPRIEHCHAAAQYILPVQGNQR
jgi:hypothetical protein